MNSRQGESQIKVMCLGAGQQVGRSCVLVTLYDKTVMFDVGIHMLFTDARRYPEFSRIYSHPNTINQAVDLVIITHFHLDHCGALPYLTEEHGYKGPILTSTPTKALLPIMLEDYRKVISQSKEEQFYTFGTNEVKESTSKVKSISLFETIQANGIKVTSYYAGHVLGACMYHVEYKGLSAVYTGDYNSYADRHLGAASAPRLNPNILITETTYATTIRDTKRQRQRSMLHLITETVQKGGKVLIPVFALGRAQELTVLLETYWKRTDNNVPIYFSAGLIEKANFFYRLFVDWQNENIQQQFQGGDNIFEFKKVKPFDKSLIRADFPYVLFATPGMLHAGTSVQVFKEWCGDARNTLIIPGYCVEGTLGNRLLNGAKEVTIDKKVYDVKMRIQNVSFSAHADAKGIINILRNVDPDEIVFVHGDKSRMATFQPIVEEQLNKKVHMPPNHVSLTINARQKQQILLKEPLSFSQGFLVSNPKMVQHCLIKQSQILKEVNRIIELTGEEDIYVTKNEINATLTVNSNKKLLQLASKHSKTIQIGSSSIKKQGQFDEDKQEQVMIKGDLNSLLSLLQQADQN